jgi:hypothetical protein
MKLKKNYKIGFDIWGLILFGIIMIPNFFWFAVPAPNDILRIESVTKNLDMVASISQVAMIIVLCLIINKTCEKIHKLFLIGIVVSCLLYYVGWIFYYNGVTNPLIILDLCVTPCLAFLFFAIARKNIIAVVPTMVFMICHLIYGIVNYIVL